MKSFSESGQPCGFDPCERYKLLEAENAALRSELSATRKALVETELTLGTLNYQAQRLMQELRGGA